MVVSRNSIDDCDFPISLARCYGQLEIVVIYIQEYSTISALPVTLWRVNFLSQNSIGDGHFLARLQCYYYVQCTIVDSCYQGSFSIGYGHF